MHNKKTISILLILFWACGFLGTQDQVKIISDFGFINRYSLSSDNQIEQVTLGLILKKEVYFRLSGESETLKTGKMHVGLNFIRFDSADLNLEKAGELKFDLDFKDGDQILKRKIVMTVEGPGKPIDRTASERDAVYKIKLFYKNRMVMSKTDRINREEAMAGVKKSNVPNEIQPYSIPKSVFSPEDQAQGGGVSLFNLAMLGAKEVVKGILRNKEKKESLKVRLNSDLIGYIKVLRVGSFQKVTRKLHLKLL